MANIFEPKNRHVVPGFRSFADTAALGELSRTSVTAPTSLPFDIDPLLLAWGKDKSVGLAGDLLSAATASGLRPQQAIEAAEFILGRTRVASSALVSAAQSILRPTDDKSAAAEPLPRLSSFLDAHIKDRIRSRIRELRQSTIRFPGDPILLVELARLYSITGHSDKAKKNMRVALSLAPGNRFVLRSAARMLAHYGEAERAYDLLRRCPGTPYDPWLLSTELALAGLVGQESRLVRRGTSVVRSGGFSPFSLTELSSGLGTIELLGGRRRRARDLFKAALLRPNDNSLAQVEWAFSTDRLFDVDLRSFNVRRNYEALALEAFSNQDWRQVIEHCESWFMDMPFAKRPIMMGSHVATVVLEDYPAGQLFCQVGLVAHPGNPQLLNNYAYALALGGKADDALQVLEGTSISGVDDLPTQVCLIATTGLAYFRKGEIERGRLLYDEAMETALRVPHTSFHQLAVLNYAREEILANRGLADAKIEKVRRMKVDPREVTLGILRDKVLSLYGARAGGARPIERVDRS